MAKGKELTQMSFVGMVGMWDPPRSGVAQSISTLLENGVDVKMITGDGKETGEAIGMQWSLQICFVLRLLNFWRGCYFCRGPI